MSWLQSVGMAVVLPLINTLMAAVTPDLKKRLYEFLEEWYLSARQTPNPYDDIASSFLLAIFSIPTPTGKTAKDIAGLHNSLVDDGR